MARYHINPRTGDPGVCRARIACPYGTAEEHFDTAQEAREAFEAGQLDQVLPRLEKALDLAIDLPPTSAEMEVLYSEVQTGYVDGVSVERAAASKLALPDQLAHEVGNERFFVTTHSTVMPGGKGKEGTVVLETKVIENATGEVHHSMISEDFTRDSKVGQHENGIDWAANVVREDAADFYETQKALGLTGPILLNTEDDGYFVSELTDETMQEMDEFYSSRAVEDFGDKPFIPEGEETPF